MKRNQLGFPESVHPLERIKEVENEGSEVTVCHSDKNNLSLG